MMTDRMTDDAEDREPGAPNTPHPKSHIHIPVAQSTATAPPDDPDPDACSVFRTDTTHSASHRDTHSDSAQCMCV
eukprot:scaffold761_cov146-Isochrysis_galbana.AAC.2